MRFIIITIAIALLGFVVQLYLPWWSLAFVAFILGYLANLSGVAAFGAGMLGSGGVWFVYALWLNMANDSLLATKIGKVFGLPMLEPLLLVLIATLISGLLGGLAASSGHHLRKMLATNS